MGFLFVYKLYLIRLDCALFLCFCKLPESFANSQVQSINKNKWKYKEAGNCGNTSNSTAMQDCKLNKKKQASYISSQT